VAARREAVCEKGSIEMLPTKHERLLSQPEAGSTGGGHRWRMAGPAGSWPCRYKESGREAEEGDVWYEWGGAAADWGWERIGTAGHDMRAVYDKQFGPVPAAGLVKA